MPNAAPRTDELDGKMLLVDTVVLTAFVALAYWTVRAGAPQLGPPIIALTPAIIELFNRFLRRKDWPVRRLRIAIALGLAYVAGYLTPTIQAWIATPTVTLSLDHDGPVKQRENVTLRWRGLRDGDAPGIFVYARQSGMYYPQHCGMAPATAGTQSCRIEIGGDTENGQAFEAVTTTLDDAARQHVAEYWGNTISAGLPALPEGARRIQAINIVRRDQ
jgi:hypothetical protein